MHALEKKLADCSQLIISLTLIQMRGLPMYLIVEFVWNFSNECSLHLLNAENINSQLSFLCPFAQKSEVFVTDCHPHKAVLVLVIIYFLQNINNLMFRSPMLHF